MVDDHQKEACLCTCFDRGCFFRHPNRRLAPCPQDTLACEPSSPLHNSNGIRLFATKIGRDCEGQIIVDCNALFCKSADILFAALYPEAGEALPVVDLRN